MLPVQKPTHEYRTLEEIRQRKEETSRGEYIASLVSKGFIAFDLFLTARKLLNTYGFLFGLKKSKKKKHK